MIETLSTDAAPMPGSALRHTAFGLLVLLALLWASLPAQAQSPTPAEIQRLQQLSPAERERLAAQFRQQQQTEVVRQEGVDSTDDSVVGAMDSREREKETEDLLKREVRRYRDKVSVPTAELQPFGYALFAGETSTFAPTTEIPIPSEYRIGPGDVVRLQLFGQQNELHELQVSRDGSIQMPRVGPVSVAGLDFDEMRKQLRQLVAERFIGVEASITLGELRSIRVFVMGEARNPGAYTVSSLSNITHALFVSGGVKVSGSLRNVRLIRNGEVISTLDLYDLLLKGDTSGDQRLMPGDVIFIPTVGKTAAIGGQVRRPAVYELKTEKSIAQLVELAGGYRSEAYPRFTKIKRIGENFERSVEDLDLTVSANLNKQLQMGDEITIGSINDLLSGYVSLQGEVRRPGVYEWKKTLRVSALVGAINKDVKDSADLNYAMIIREINDERDVTAIAFNLRQALENPGTGKDPILQDRDRLLVFPREGNRTEMFESAQDNLRKQARLDERPALVSIRGSVRAPGTYPLAAAQTPRQLLDAAGGVRPLSIDKDYILMVREINPEGDIEVEQFTLGALTERQEQMELRPGDQLLLFDKDEARDALLDSIIVRLERQVAPGLSPRTVTVSGQVRFPGRYPLPASYSIQELIRAAGGLLDSTYLGEVEVARVTLEKERAVTRLLTTTVDPDTEASVSDVLLLQPQDRVFIKQLPEFGARLAVTLQGEVRFPGTYTIRRGEMLSSLIARAGGLTSHAYPKGTVFARASLREQEAERLREAEARLERDLAALALDESAQFRAAADQDTAQQLEKVLEQIQSTRPVGRLVIDLPAILAGNKAVDVRLMDGDTLTVPERTQTVTVIGEIQFPTSHLFNSGLSVGDYLERSGGPTRNADERRIYVIRADGSVWLPNRSRWFAGRGGALEPGDTIVVPLDIDQINRLELATGLSQVIYQMALGAAAVRSF